MLATFEFKESDLFSSDAQFLVNTVNCEGVMGKGIALEFKNRYPEMFLEYQKWCKLGFVKIGNITEYRIPGGDRSIINFPTKDRWRKPSTYLYVRRGLYYLAQYIVSHHAFTPGETRVAIPALGCGNGGLDWNIVRSMVIAELVSVPAIFEIYPPR